MKRDFSNSTRDQIIRIINDRDALYADDISSIDLFVCKDATDADFQVYSADISEEVRTANSGVSGSNVEADDLILKTNQVVDEAHTLDSNYTTKIETDTANTVVGYADDLDIFVSALAVGHLGDSKTEMLENLGKYDSDSVFGEPGEFSTNLEDRLYSRLYDDLVVNGEMNYDHLEVIMQQDSLTDREKIVLTEVVNSVYIDENGELDYEEFEKFLESSYISTRVHIGDEYYLSGAFNDFSDYYQLYVDMLMLEYGGNLKDETDNKIKEWYKSVAQIRGIVYGVDTYYQSMFMVVDENGTTELNFTISEDSENSGWLNVFTEAYDIDGKELKKEISVSCINELNTLMNQYEIEQLTQQIVDPDRAYNDALAKGITDYVLSMIGKNTIGKVGDGKGKKLLEGKKILEIFSSAEEAREQQGIDNKINQEAINATYHQALLENINVNFSSCNATLVSYGDESEATNYQYSMEGLYANIDAYNNDSDTENKVKYEDVIEAIYYPENADWDHLEGYLTYFGTSVGGGI